MNTSRFSEQIERDIKKHIYDTSELKNNLLRKQCRIDGVPYSSFEDGLSKINKNEDNITTLLVDSIKNLVDIKSKINETYINSCVQFSQKDGNLMYNHLGKLSTLPTSTHKVFNGKNVIEHELNSFKRVTNQNINKDCTHTDDYLNQEAEILSFDDLNIVMNALEANCLTDLFEYLKENHVDIFLSSDELSNEFDEVSSLMDDWLVND